MLSGCPGCTVWRSEQRSASGCFLSTCGTTSLCHEPATVALVGWLGGNNVKKVKFVCVFAAGHSKLCLCGTEALGGPRKH